MTDRGNSYFRLEVTAFSFMAILAIFFGMLVILSVSENIRADSEPNDDFAQANPITPGIHPGNVDDTTDPSDYYNITLTAGQTLWANLTPDAALDADLRIYDQNQAEVIRDEAPGVGGVTRVSWTTNSAQVSYNYYIQVLAAIGSGPYSMEVDITSQNDANSGGDAGDDFPSATPITQGTYPNNFLKDNDFYDYYNITLTAGQTLWVNVTPDAALDADLRIYNQIQVEVVRDDAPGVGGVTRVSWTTNSAQTTYNYYIYVLAATGSGSYGMEVDVTSQNDANSGGDAGDDFASATLITLGTYSNNLLKDEDLYDYYSFTLTGNGTKVWVNLTVFGAYQIDLYLYDALQMQVATVSVSAGTDGVDHVFDTAQTVYIGSYSNCYLQNEDLYDFYSLTLTGNGTKVWVNITVFGVYQIDLYLYDKFEVEVAWVCL
jgi:hypothetical protein